MKEVIYYEASDGKRFEDEYECLAYEFGAEFKPVEKTLKLWDGDGDKIEITHRTRLDRAYAIHCSSILAAFFLKKWGDREEVCTPYDNIDLECCEEIPLGDFIWFDNNWHELSEVTTLFKKMKQQMSQNENKIFMPTF